MECTHECATCTSACDSVELAPESERAPLINGASVKKVFAIAGGKGGAGRSSLCCLIANELKSRGLKPAIIDADITGDSIAHYLGTEELCKDSEDYFYPVDADGIKMVSVEQVLAGKANPLAWRANTSCDAVLMFWTETMWENIDVLLIDMPAEISDIALTIYQALPVNGTILTAKPNVLSISAAMRSGGASVISGTPVRAFILNGIKEESEASAAAAESVKDAFRLDKIIRCPYNKELAAKADEGKICEIQLAGITEAADIIVSIL